jgi:hypothetical protein
LRQVVLEWVRSHRAVAEALASYGDAPRLRSFRRHDCATSWSRDHRKRPSAPREAVWS